jgi:hypothetical protein
VLLALALVVVAEAGSAHGGGAAVRSVHHDVHALAG